MKTPQKTNLRVKKLTDLLKGDTKAERQRLEKLILRRFLAAVGGDTQQRGSKLVQT